RPPPKAPTAKPSLRAPLSLFSIGPNEWGTRASRAWSYTHPVRVILFTGKGGVGKTSVAAATALRCAQLGHRTIVMSTDPAHSLGDAFDMELGHRLERIAPTLWAHELSALREVERHW